MTDANGRTYRLEPIDASGVFLGLGAVQCLLTGTGIAASVGGLSLGLPVYLALLPIAAGGALSFGRIAGEPIWEWLPVAVTWAWRGRRGRRWLRPLPFWPHDEDVSMPPCLDGIEIVEIGKHNPVGAVHDRHRRTLTSVVPVKGSQFLARARADQDFMLASWGDLLGQFAVERGLVTHISWSDLARPSGLREHVQWIDSRIDDMADSDAADSYRQLMDAADAVAMAHDVVVTVTVACDRLGRHRGRSSDEALRQSLIASTEALERGLRSAGLEPSAALDATGLRRLIQARLRPTCRRPGTPGRLAQRLGIDPKSTGPIILEEHWREIHLDDSWQRTWWIAAWPRSPVPPAWMEPFLSTGGITRAVTVVLRPVPTRQSRRRIERDLVKLESDAATKEEKGRRVDARHRRATQALLDREHEIVAGYPEVAYAGLVTVSASTIQELDEHSEIIEQLARETGLELRVLAGRQASAWAAALPLGLAPGAVLPS